MLEKGKDWTMIAAHDLIAAVVVLSGQLRTSSVKYSVSPARDPLFAVLS